MLNPDATNRMTCSTCGWTRIVDHMRPYRGGHTHPETGAECHEVLVFEQVSPLPPEVALLGEKPRITDQQLTELLSTGDPKDRAKGEAEMARRVTLVKRIDAEVYTGPDAAVEAKVDTATPPPASDGKYRRRHRMTLDELRENANKIAATGPKGKSNA